MLIYAGRFVAPSPRDSFYGVRRYRVSYGLFCAPSETPVLSKHQNGSDVSTTATASFVHTELFGVGSTVPHELQTVMVYMPEQHVVLGHKILVHHLLYVRIVTPRQIGSISVIDFVNFPEKCLVKILEVGGFFFCPTTRTKNNFFPSI